MHKAPSVVFPVGPCAFQAALLLLLGLLGAVVLAAWWWLSASSAMRWPAVCGGVGVLLWLGLAWWTWRHAPVGCLRWSSQARRSLDEAPGRWYWSGSLVSESEGVPLQSVEAVWDWQEVMLLRLHPANAATRWIWVERIRDPLHWNDLRRALMPARD